MALIGCEPISGIGHAQQPADLADRGLSAAFPLALGEPFERNLLEGRGRREFRGDFGPLLLEHRIEPGGDRFFRLTTFLPRIGERDRRPGAEVKRLLQPAISVAEAPELRAGGLDDEEKALAVGEVVRLRLGLGGGDLELCQHRTSFRIPRVHPAVTK